MNQNSTYSSKQRKKSFLLFLTLSHFFKYFRASTLHKMEKRTSPLAPSLPTSALLIPSPHAFFTWPSTIAAHFLLCFIYMMCKSCDLTRPISSSLPTNRVRPAPLQSLHPFHVIKCQPLFSCPFLSLIHLHQFINSLPLLPFSCYAHPYHRCLTLLHQSAI